MQSVFHRSIAEFTLDHGRCPPWLFSRMVRLARAIIYFILQEFSPEELVKRLSDSVWFQSFGCVLAFDWNASGLTTTTTAAIKQAISQLGQEQTGIFICGGKGKTSKKTPEEILFWSDRLGFKKEKADDLVKASKLTAKIDSSLIQDGFNLYHHTFVFTKSGVWAVIQQGMNTKLKRARRYHWYSRYVKDPTTTPHSSISSEIQLKKVFNLVMKEAKENKSRILELVEEKKELFFQVKRLQNDDKTLQLSLLNLSDQDFDESYKAAELAEVKQIFENPYLQKNIGKIIQQPASEFTDILLMRGVGPKTIRALSLVAEIIYGAKPSYTDPVRYTYAFGGKDAIPYPVDRKNYDKIIEIMQKAIRKSGFSYWERGRILKRLEDRFPV